MMAELLVAPAFLETRLPALALRSGENVPLIGNGQLAFLCALFNSFTVDWLVRSKLSSHLQLVKAARVEFKSSVLLQPPNSARPTGFAETRPRKNLASVTKRTARRCIQRKQCNRS